jgi:type III pantothenate kinase
MAGPEISLEALSRRASRIKPIPLKAPSRALGRSTKSGLQSGLVWGAAGGVDALIRKIRLELGGRVPAVATGGLARLISPHCVEIDHQSLDLTLQGMRLTWLYAQAQGVKP